VAEGTADMAGVFRIAVAVAGFATPTFFFITYYHTSTYKDTAFLARILYIVNQVQLNCSMHKLMKVTYNV